MGVQHKNVDRDPMHHHQEEPSLKGTLVSVFLLGTFIIVSWVSVFLIFIDRQ